MSMWTYYTTIPKSFYWYPDLGYIYIDIYILCIQFDSGGGDHICVYMYIYMWP